jgi:hypothetical protein
MRIIPFLLILLLLPFVALAQGIPEHLDLKQIEEMYPYKFYCKSIAPIQFLLEQGDENEAVQGYMKEFVASGECVMSNKTIVAAIKEIAVKTLEVPDGVAMIFNMYGPGSTEHYIGVVMPQTKQAPVKRFDI